MLYIYIRLLLYSYHGFVMYKPGKVMGYLPKKATQRLKVSNINCFVSSKVSHKL
jgi:hypothetical protein